MPPLPVIAADPAAPPLSSRRSRWLTSAYAAALVLGLFYLLLLAAVRDKSATFDEPGHAVAGYAYWKTKDYRLDAENGILPQRWFGLALLPIEQTLPASETPEWRHADSWKVADTWLNRSGNDAPALLRRGRAAAGIFAVSLGAIVWWWSRRLFGPAGAMISLLLYTLSPTVLAHGALMTSDMAAALFFLLSLAAFSLLLERVTAARLTFSAMAMGGLFIAKMSAPLIVPVVLVLAAMRVLDREPLRLGNVNVHRRGKKLLIMGGAALAHVAVIGLVIWAAFGFRFSAHPEGTAGAARFRIPWEAVLRFPVPSDVLETLGLDPAQKTRADEILRAHGVVGTEWTHGAHEAMNAIERDVLEPHQAGAFQAAMQAPALEPAARLVMFARQHRLLPEAYLYGCAHVWRFSRERSAFLNGRLSEHGWRMFFPYVFAVKTPLATFGIVAMALAALAIRRPSRPRLAALLPLLLFFGLYWAVAIASEINLGLRHLLPVHPALFVLCGAAGLWCGSPPGARMARWPGGALAALLLLLLVDVLYCCPNYIAYFNGVVRPSEGYLHVIDSSLDWGQELPELKRTLDRENANVPTFLAYFGTASPEAHGITARQIYSYLEGDRAAKPAFKVLSGPQADASLLTALRRMPEYDPAMVYPAERDGAPATLLVKRASALELSAGVFYISASLLQPVHYPRAYGFWSERHESVYQQLREVTLPLRSEPRAVRVAAVNRFPPETWNRIVRDFEEYRFARLAAWLRPRGPDGHVNYAVLVFRLTAAELDAALNGPPPLGQ